MCCGTHDSSMTMVWCAKVFMRNTYYTCRLTNMKKQQLSMRSIAVSDYPTQYWRMKNDRNEETLLIYMLFTPFVPFSKPFQFVENKNNKKKRLFIRMLSYATWPGIMQSHRNECISIRLHEGDEKKNTHRNWCLCSVSIFIQNTLLVRACFGSCHRSTFPIRCEWFHWHTKHIYLHTNRKTTNDDDRHKI